MLQYSYAPQCYLWQLKTAFVDVDWLGAEALTGTDERVNCKVNNRQGEREMLLFEL